MCETEIFCMVDREGMVIDDEEGRTLTLMPREYVGQRIFEPNKTHKLCLQFPSASLIETKRYMYQTI